MSSFTVHVPLTNFIWSGANFTLAPDIQITRSKPGLGGQDSQLAFDERDLISETDHWLTFDLPSVEKLKPAEIVNLFLIALWLVKPTRAHAAFRFETETRAGGDISHTLVRLLDRFSWVEGTTSDIVSDADLARVTSFFTPLRSSCSARRRLSNALFLTLSGCTAHNWAVAFLCHAAAAEAILTCETGPGITRRLALAYACLVESSTPARDSAFREFSNLYKVRSNIMHGRVYNVVESSQLDTLARFQELLRRLWKKILSSNQTLQALERSDAQRQAFIKQLQSGYVHPP